MSTRREFITLLGGSAAAWPLAVRAQDNDRTYRLGFLLPSSRHGVVDAFFDELRLNGFVEGKNLVVMPGGFEAVDDNLAERAAALVNAAPDAIVAGPAPPLRALQAITRTIPLIGMSEDMVGEGLVASLARPGANITGISLLSPELDGKRQEILIEAVPGARRIAAMVDSRQTPPYHLQALQHAARSRGVELSLIGVSGPEEIAAAIDAAKTGGAEALNFLATPITRSSWSGSRQCGCRLCFNGRKPWKPARSRATVRASRRCTGNGRAWWRASCAAPTLPTRRSSSQRGFS
jgi:ABC transporter substrate binding protein